LSFKDHFSAQAADYAKFRPHYPQELYDFILSHVKTKDTAWDVATGNGQVAVALAEYFNKVIATDASKNQIAHATRHPKVSYLVSMAENSGLPDGVCDLITVGQALHWFDFEKFFEEVKRVAKKECFFASWGYRFQHISPEIDVITRRLDEELVGPYWPKERVFVNEHYNNIPLPFKPIEAPQFFLQCRWNMHEMMGYLNTWSSTQLYIKAKNQNPLDIIEKDMLKAWGNPEQERDIRWPIYFKAGYIAQRADAAI
jgi:hypothetical protein